MNNIKGSFPHLFDFWATVELRASCQWHIDLVWRLAILKFAVGHPATPDAYVTSKLEVSLASSSISGVSPMTSHDRLPHCDIENWYLTVGREMAEELLSGKPQGTFLIRPSSDGQHALSIICAGRVGHCKILQVKILAFEFAVNIL